MVQIRAEQSRYVSAIRHVNERAFQRPAEADLIEYARALKVTDETWFPILHRVEESEVWLQFRVD